MHLMVECNVIKRLNKYLRRETFSEDIRSDNTAESTSSKNPWYICYRYVRKVRSQHENLQEQDKKRERERETKVSIRMARLSGKPRASLSLLSPSSSREQSLKNLPIGERE